MNAMKMLLLCVTLGFASGEATAASNPPATQREAGKSAKLYGDAIRGKEIADRWCVGCHSAGPTVDDRIQSFPSLAGDRRRSEGAIRTFLMQPHRPMPPLELGTQQIEDIIAFLQTVRPDSAK